MKQNRLKFPSLKRIIFIISTTFAYILLGLFICLVIIAYQIGNSEYAKNLEKVYNPDYPEERNK